MKPLELGWVIGREKYGSVQDEIHEDLEGVASPADKVRASPVSSSSTTDRSSVGSLGDRSTEYTWLCTTRTRNWG